MSARAVVTVVAAMITATLAGVPVVLLALGSFARHWYWPAVLPGELDTRAWSYVASPASGIGSALAASLWIAFLVTALALTTALPAARAMALHDFRGKHALLFLLLLPVLA